MALLKIPVIKGHTDLFLNPDETQDWVYQYALYLGFKLLVNRGMVMIKDEAAIVAKAKQNVQDIYDGKVRTHIHERQRF